MNSSLFGITWAAEYNGLWIAVIFLLWLLVVYKAVLHFKVVRQLTSGRSYNNILAHYSPLKTYLKTCLLLLGIISLGAALLRPQWGKKEEVVHQMGRDLFIAVDISKSMLAKDVTPNRLEFAKQKIKQLVNTLASDRVGLILFAGSAFVQCPLTRDYQAFFMFLDALDNSTVASGGTAIDQAIQQALTIFKSMADKKNKLLVLVTDGEDFSPNLSSIKESALQEGLHIFTLGVGTPEGAPIPLFDPAGKQMGHQKDKNGTVVISRLNEQLLSDLSHKVGGKYLHATKDDSDVKKLVSLVQSYEKESLEDTKIDHYQEQYHWFLLVSLMCFALEWIL
ncbi:BatB protein [Candidatus Dependentiae bacterium Noda2021]|nr:BatB protein [Candidatus Dependentiae bacterium Noda2021]